MKRTFSVVKASRLEIKITEFEEQLLFSNKLSYFLKHRQSYSEQWDSSEYLVRNVQYYIRAFLYDSEGNSVTLKNQSKAEFSYDKNHFELIKESNIELILKPKQLISKTPISAKLNTLVHSLSVNIVLPLKMLKPLSNSLHLPFLHSLNELQ